MMLSVALVFPYFINEVFNDFKSLGFELIYGVIKGLFFFSYIDYGQRLGRDTASSRTFMGAVAVGFIALINYGLLNEDLSNYQLLSALLISCVGILYYFKGHLSETSNKSHK